MNEKNSPSWSRAFYITLTVFLLCFLYAFVRYNIVRSVSFEHLPLYITNKAISLAATIVIGFSFVLGPLARFFPNTFAKSLSLRKTLGISGFGIAAIHAVMSLLLFNPANYSKFFLENGKLNGTGELTMLFGILAFFIFSILALMGIPSIEEKISSDQWKSIQRLGYLAYIFVLLHVAIMGWSGWFDAKSWQYGLASITLIAALFIIFVLLMRFIVIIFPRNK